MPAPYTVIIHPANAEQHSAIMAFISSLNLKFELGTEEQYDKAFIQRIEDSREQYLAGKGTRVNQTQLGDFLRGA